MKRLRPRPIIWRRALPVGVTTLLVALVYGSMFAGMTDGIVAAGADRERARIVAGVATIAMAAALGSLMLRATSWVRLTALASSLVIIVFPFLQHAARPVPGLQANVVWINWVLQPLGMMLLAALAAQIGAGVGSLLRSDTAALWRWARPRRKHWMAVAAAAVLLAVAAGPAVYALEVGPSASLYRYGEPVVTHHVTRVVPAHWTGTPPSPLPVGAGSIDRISVDGRNVLVAVPAAAATGFALPVLYLLHGDPGQPSSFLDNWPGPQILDQQIANGVLPPTLLVMPDGQGPGGRQTHWGDSAFGGDIETWVLTRLVPTIDAKYHTAGPWRRAIAGLSSGGFGAINLSLRHPDVFRYAASWSGFFVGDPVVFGGAAGNNSPTVEARNLAVAERMPILLATGDDDPHSLADARQFDTELTSLAWPAHKLDIIAGGGHNWTSWQTMYVHTLTWLGGLWGGCEPSGDGVICPTPGRAPTAIPPQLRS